MKKNYLFLILPFFLIFSGCKAERIKNFFQKTGQKTSNQKSEEDILSQKLDWYIYCFNATHEQINSTEENYLRDLEPLEQTCKTGQTEFPLSRLEAFKAGQRPKLIIHSLYKSIQGDIHEEKSVESCEKAVKQVNQGGVHFPELNKVASDYTQAYVELATLSAQAYDYYNQKNYQDDGCAKGREMHPKLMNLFKKLGSLNPSFEKEIDRVEKDFYVGKLEKYEKEGGKDIFWHDLNFYLQAKELVNTIPTLEDQTFDKQTFINQFQIFEKSYNDFSSQMLTEAKEAKRHHFNLYDSSCKSYYVNAKLSYRKLTAGESLSDGELEQLINQYNSYVESRNRASNLAVPID